MEIYVIKCSVKLVFREVFFFKYHTIYLNVYIHIHSTHIQ